MVEREIPVSVAICLLVSSLSKRSVDIHHLRSCGVDEESIRSHDRDGLDPYKNPLLRLLLGRSYARAVHAGTCARPDTANGCRGNVGQWSAPLWLRYHSAHRRASRPQLSHFCRTTVPTAVAGCHAESAGRTRRLLVRHGVRATPLYAEPWLHVDHNRSPHRILLPTVTTQMGGRPVATGDFIRTKRMSNRTEAIWSALTVCLSNYNAAHERRKNK